MLVCELKASHYSKIGVLCISSALYLLDNNLDVRYFDGMRQTERAIHIKIFRNKGICIPINE